MTFDLIRKVHIDRAFLEVVLTPSGRDKLAKVKACFVAYPDVLDWLGDLAGIGQSPIEPGVSTDLNIGKQQLFMQILAMISAADLTEDQAARALEGR